MWKQVKDSRRANREAMAGSIYIRKKSIQNIQPTTSRQAPISSSRDSSGKIVKNTRNSIMNTPGVSKISYTVSKEIPSLASTMRDPFTEKKNIIENDMRTGKTLWFMRMDEPENKKIKEIQTKYRTMLDNYEKKKRQIATELDNLKGGIHTKKKQKSKPKIERKLDYQQDQIISTRKRINSVVVSENKTTKKQKLINRYPSFFSLLKTQLKLEEDLRELKYQSKSKSEQIIEILQQKGYKREDAQKFIQLDIEQTDPFFQPKDEISAPKLVAKILQFHEQCESNWKNNIVNRIDPTEAKQIFNELNFEKKEEINLRSFVREIGFHFEKHYRNRDLFRIFGRINPCSLKNFLGIFSTETI